MHKHRLALLRRAWLAAYDLEMARDAFACRGQYLRSAACSVVLALLLMLRGGR